MKLRNSLFQLSGIVFLAALFTACNQKAEQYTRGIGIYPGDPREDFSPVLIPDNATYRNLARLRPAWHSSSYDYNLTAQLVTDGIITGEMPDFITLATSSGIISKNEREWPFDHNSVTETKITGSDVWVQLGMHQGKEKTFVTGISIEGSLVYDEKRPGAWQFLCSGSDDGVSWTELEKNTGWGFPGQERPDPFAMFRNTGQQRRGQGRRRTDPFSAFFGSPDPDVPRPSFTFNFRAPVPTRIVKQSFHFSKPVAFSYYRVSLKAGCMESLTFGNLDLYDVELFFTADDGTVSDRKSFKSGVREMSYTVDTVIDALNIYVNGRRFIGRGGNWGFPESNLEYRGREYDIAVAYHADMNFTMIRNWVGQTGDEEFYEACDRHGIMVWQDFWLANPVDGPNPDNPAMFMSNAEDFVKRIRNHPSIGLYCGRNEGNPPEVIDTALRALLPVIHPGIHYISHSSMGVVSGGGPYNALPPRDYFLLYGNNKFHSERGMPNVMNYESLLQTIPESLIWPQSSLWGMHDYCLDGAQRAASFNEMIEKGFGKARDAREFTELAQWINYNGYRAIFEGRSTYRQGMLLWMSHPAWPSMVWQTYDYYFDPTAAYFGCKKGSEPIHIQWNPIWDFKGCDSVEVVNYNAGDRRGLIAKAQIINMDGTVKWENEKTLDCKEDQTIKIFRLDWPADLSPVHFIKLTLKEGEKIISENFYWRGLENGNYQALRELPKTTLDHKTSVTRSGDKWLLTTKLVNNTSTPALMVRLKVTGNKTGERILPVFFSDNYVFLMPGDEKVITMRLSDRDTRREKPGVVISGFNIM